MSSTFWIWHGVDSIKHNKRIQVVNECFLHQHNNKPDKIMDSHLKDKPKQPFDV